MIEVSTSLQAYGILRNDINPYAEELWILALDSQMTLLRKEMLFRGTVDFCLIHPRDIFRCLVLANASSFILAHNHPSNNAQPSEQDLILTRKIHQLSLMFEIPLNDHIVLCESNYFSMADNGYFKKWRKSRSRI